jgi:hypothetical protein
MKRKYIMAHDENISTKLMEGIINKRQHISSVIDASSIEMEFQHSSSSGGRTAPPCELSKSGFFNAQDFDFRAINAMARFYLALRPIKATRCSDLNITSKSYQISYVEHIIRHDNLLVLPRSPWELGCRFNIDVVMASDIHGKLTLVEDTDEYVFFNI